MSPCCYVPRVPASKTESPLLFPLKNRSSFRKNDRSKESGAAINIFFLFVRTIIINICFVILIKLLCTWYNLKPITQTAAALLLPCLCCCVVSVFSGREPCFFTCSFFDTRSRRFDFQLPILLGDHLGTIPVCFFSTLPSGDGSSAERSRAEGVMRSIRIGEVLDSSHMCK